jgi:hypothetical protein
MLKYLLCFCLLALPFLVHAQTATTINTQVTLAWDAPSPVPVPPPDEYVLDQKVDAAAFAELRRVPATTLTTLVPCSVRMLPRSRAFR